MLCFQAQVTTQLPYSVATDQTSLQGLDEAMADSIHMLSIDEEPKNELIKARLQQSKIGRFLVESLKPAVKTEDDQTPQVDGAPATAPGVAKEPSAPEVTTHGTSSYKQINYNAIPSGPTDLEDLVLDDKIHLGHEVHRAKAHPEFAAFMKYAKDTLDYEQDTIGTDESDSFEELKDWLQWLSENMLGQYSKHSLIELDTLVLVDGEDPIEKQDEITSDIDLARGTRVPRDDTPSVQKDADAAAQPEHPPMAGGSGDASTEGVQKAVQMEQLPAQVPHDVGQTTPATEETVPAEGLVAATLLDDVSDTSAVANVSAGQEDPMEALKAIKDTAAASVALAVAKVSARQEELNKFFGLAFQKDPAFLKQMEGIGVHTGKEVPRVADKPYGRQTECDMFFSLLFRHDPDFNLAQSLKVKSRRPKNAKLLGGNPIPDAVPKTRSARKSRNKTNDKAGVVAEAEVEKAATGKTPQPVASSAADASMAPNASVAPKAEGVPKAKGKAAAKATAKAMEVETPTPKATAAKAKAAAKASVATLAAAKKAAEAVEKLKESGKKVKKDKVKDKKSKDTEKKAKEPSKGKKGKK